MISLISDEIALKILKKKKKSVKFINKQETLIYSVSFSWKTSMLDSISNENGKKNE